MIALLPHIASDPPSGQELLPTVVRQTLFALQFYVAHAECCLPAPPQRLSASVSLRWRSCETLETHYPQRPAKAVELGGAYDTTKQQMRKDDTRASAVESARLRAKYSRLISSNDGTRCFPQ